MGIFNAFLDDPGVRLFGFEAGRRGHLLGPARRAVLVRHPGVLHGAVPTCCRTRTARPPSPLRLGRPRLPERRPGARLAARHRARGVPPGDRRRGHGGVPPAVPDRGDHPGHRVRARAGRRDRRSVSELGPRRPPVLRQPVRPRRQGRGHRRGAGSACIEDEPWCWPTKESSCRTGIGRAVRCSVARAPRRRLGREGRAALIGYLPVGYPTSTAPSRRCPPMIDAGADVVELGRALQRPGHGRTHRPARRRGARSPAAPGSATSSAPSRGRRRGAPVLVMTYWNLVLRYGVDAFARDLAAAGGAGPHHPRPHPRRGGRLDRRLGRATASTACSSSRPARPPSASLNATSPRRGFVYAASTMGVTGDAGDGRLRGRAARRRAPARSTDLPVCVGLGVSNGEQAAEVARVRRRRHRRLGPRPHAARRRRRRDAGSTRLRRPRRPTSPRVSARSRSRWRPPDASPLLPLAIPSPPTGVWHLGPLPAPRLRLCILLGIVVALWMTQRRLGRARRRSRTRSSTSRSGRCPFGIVGGRIYHVITSPDAYFGEGGNPWNAFSLGGRSRHLGRRRARRRRRLDRLPRQGVRFLDFGDAAAPGLLVAQAIGRLGNWFNQELFGSADRPALGAAVYVDAAAGHAVLDANGNPVVLGVYHPTFLYEMLWCLAARGAAHLARPPARLRPRPRLRALHRGLPASAAGRRVHAHRRREPDPRVCGSTSGCRSWCSCSVCLVASGSGADRPIRTSRSPTPTLKNPRNRPNLDIRNESSRNLGR